MHKMNKHEKIIFYTCLGGVTLVMLAMIIVVMAMLINYLVN